jgi:hypothetical protein
MKKDVAGLALKYFVRIFIVISNVVLLDLETIRHLGKVTNIET